MQSKLYQDMIPGRIETGAVLRMVLVYGNLSETVRLQGRWPWEFQILMLTLEAIGLQLPSPHSSLLVDSSSLLMLVSTWLAGNRLSIHMVGARQKQDLQR